VAAASIAAGDIGPVIYNASVYEAVNQSDCDVIVGNRVGLHISPNCEAFFVPCVCCDPESGGGGETCCETYPCCCPFVVCAYNATYDLFAFNVFWQSWTWPNNTWLFQSEFFYCDEVGENNHLILTFDFDCCTDGVPIMNWTATETDLTPVASGSFNIDGICADPPRISRHVLDLGDGCTIPISFAREWTDELCGDYGPPSSPCCDQSLYLCIQNVSELLPVDGGNTTFDVSVCCEAEASLEITLSCDPSTGVITMAYTYTSGMVTSSGTANLSAFCTDGSPRIITLDTICFLQMLVSTTQFDCPDCLSGGTTITTPPPPVTPPPPGP
jgi:hypothetical protein